jgi:ubiquinone/menaquinone biosynthesis C-methylase UbiE
MDATNDRTIQQRYYAETATAYETMHDAAEHNFGRAFLMGAIDHFGWESVLDVGAGTGRGLAQMRENRPHLRLQGVEPVAELREQGYSAGLPREMLVDGDGTALQFGDGEFDVACCFGVLHHVKHPELAVAELLRVSKKAILISDSNNFGQGSAATRTFKQAMNALGLWKVVDLVKTKGKGYTVTEGDGLFYSYSVFNNYKQIKQQCQSVHLFNPGDAGVNPYRTSTHVVLLGIKK